MPGPRSVVAVRRVGAELRQVLRGTGRLLAGRDLAAAAATLTFYSAIAVVPWLLLAMWSTTWWSGDDAAERRLLELRVLVPPQMGAREPFELLARTGARLDVVGALVMLLPASFYGEGLRRACQVVRPESERFTGWRSRLALVPLLLALPPLAWVVVTVAERLVPLAPDAGGGGVGDLLVRIVVAFTAVWLALALLLTWVYRAVTPGRPRWLVALVGGLATGSFLAGFLHGFQLFLTIPVDVGIPYGGLGYVGGVVAVGLWLYLLHLVVVVGWAVTEALDTRVGAA